MIISDSEKFVFVHNPKVGGMTFRTALGRYDTRENFFFEWKQNPATGRTIDMAHITLFQFRNLYPEIFAEVSGYLRFGFVRNPYTRFLSALSQHMKLATPQLRNAILANPATFYAIADHFALNVLDEDRIGADHRLVHFRRQSAYFYLEGRKWADRIHHIETAAAEVSPPVSQWLGDAVGNPINVTREFGETGYDVGALSRPALDALNAFYALDFERFGYDTV